MDFYNILLNAHKGFAYLELLLVAVFLILLLTTMFAVSGNISKGLKKVTLFTMIFFHIQFLVGAVMLISTISNGLNMGEVMKNSELRFTYVEHPFSMLLAAVLMTIVNKKVKTSEKATIPIISLAIVAILFFSYAFPWTKVFGA